MRTSRFATAENLRYRAEFRLFRCPRAPIRETSARYKLGTIRDPRESLIINDIIIVIIIITKVVTSKVVALSEEI